MQPGDTISPTSQNDQGGQPVPTSLPPVNDATTQPSAPTPQVQPEVPVSPASPTPPVIPQPVASAPAPTPVFPQAQPTQFEQPVATFDNSPWNVDEPEDDGQPVNAEVQWTASEFMDHTKAGDWYVALGIGALILAGILYFATRDFVSIVVVVVVTVLFGISGSRRPRTLTYQVTNAGLLVDQKMYPYSEIKSFSVIDEGNIHSIQLLPLKRYMPALSVYYPPEQEEEIFETLANYLPYEERKHDTVDKLMKRLRF